VSRRRQAIAAGLVLAVTTAAVVVVSKRSERIDPVVGMMPLGFSEGSILSIERGISPNRVARLHLVNLDGVDVLMSVSPVDSESSLPQPTFDGESSINVKGQELWSSCLMAEQCQVLIGETTWPRTVGSKDVVMSVITGATPEQVRSVFDQVVPAVNAISNVTAAPTFSGREVISWDQGTRLSSSLLVQNKDTQVFSSPVGAPTKVERRVVALVTRGAINVQSVDGWLTSVNGRWWGQAEPTGDIPLRPIRQSEAKRLRAELDSRQIEKISSPEWVPLGAEISAARSFGLSTWNVCIRLGLPGQTYDPNNDGACGPLTGMSRLVDGRWFISSIGIGVMEAQVGGKRLPVRSARIQGITPYSVSVLEVPADVDVVKTVRAPLGPDERNQVLTNEARRPEW
jgi:hypothetical protein